MGSRRRDELGDMERYFSGQTEGVSLERAEAVYGLLGKLLEKWQAGDVQKLKPKDQPKQPRAGRGQGKRRKPLVPLPPQSPLNSLLPSKQGEIDTDYEAMRADVG